MATLTSVSNVNSMLYFVEEACSPWTSGFVAPTSSSATLKNNKTFIHKNNCTAKEKLLEICLISPIEKGGLKILRTNYKNLHTKLELL